ncbi:MAG: PIG-L deacetylase family protein [bacterium]|nr:PIG-L deacetylase family protein [bacterium]
MAYRVKSTTNKKSKPRKFLVFSAHPDDLDFGCAGTIATLTAKGNEVAYCIITNGEKGTHKVSQTCEEMIAMREREQRAAGAIVGVSDIHFLRETDGDLEHTAELRRRLIRVMREVKPDVVLSADPGNHLFDSFGRFHRDHRITAEAVFDAIYPATASHAFFPELKQEDLLPHQMQGVWFFGTDRPNMFVDISKTIGKKLAALRAHESQIPDVKKMEERIRTRAKNEGKKKKMRYAETFRRLMF